MVAHLYIAISGFRTRRFHAHGEHRRRVTHKVQPLKHIVLEGLLIKHDLIGWRDDDVGLRIEALNAVRSPRHTGRRITLDGLLQNVVGR